MVEVGRFGRAVASVPFGPHHAWMPQPSTSYGMSATSRACLCALLCDSSADPEALALSDAILARDSGRLRIAAPAEIAALYRVVCAEADSPHIDADIRGQLMADLARVLEDQGLFPETVDDALFADHRPVR